jgi:hypothetical protein
MTTNYPAVYNSGTSAWQTLLPDISTKADKIISIESKDNFFYVEASHLNKLIKLNSSDLPIKIATDDNQEFPIGGQVLFLQVASGVPCFFQADSGVTLSGTPGIGLRAQWSSAALIKIEANTWVVVGDIA